MDAKLVEFSNLLRQNGLRVSPAESMDMLRALAVVGLPDRATVRAALRATMVKRGVDLPTFETLFDLFFSGLADAIKELTAATAGALEMNDEEFQRFLDELKKRLEEAGAELSPLASRSEEHTSELQSRQYLVCRLLLEKKKKINTQDYTKYQEKNTPKNTMEQQTLQPSRCYL